MSKNNAAGIVGIITTKPRVVMDAPTWAQKVYEAVLEYRRPSGTKDKFFVQFPGQAAGTKKALLNIKKGIVTRTSSITIPLYILIMFDQPAIVPINESHVLLTHL